MTATPVIKIVSDTATPALQGMLRRLGPQDFAEATGPALVKITRKQLRVAQSWGNKKGWPSTGFYTNFADNVHWLPETTGVLLFILPAVINGRVTGLARHVFGGAPIVPTEAGALSLPIDPMANGKSPADFPGLFLIHTKKGAYLVMHLDAVSEKVPRMVQNVKGKRTGERFTRRERAMGIVFLFKLVASTDPQPKREVLPSDEELLDTCATAGTRWIVHEEKFGAN